MLKSIRYILIAFFYILSINTLAQSQAEQQTETYFAAIKNNPKALSAFLYELPKGGDLHNHLSGATYAENMIHYCAQTTKDFCINRETHIVYLDKNCKKENLLNSAIKNPSFKNAVIDAWSMRNFRPTKQSGHDHFFATFTKFGLIVNHHCPEVLSEIMQRAGLQNEQYLELMHTADHNQSGMLGNTLGWNANFSIMQQKLLDSVTFQKIISDMQQRITIEERKAQKILRCQSSVPKAGCDVCVRYLYQVLREQPPENVFAQLLAGFAIANKDNRFVGINMVQAEDGPIATKDYRLHMQMVRFLRQQYPNVHVSLHAGELNKQLVPVEDLKFHIHDAVMVAGADRIGHGVTIANENKVDHLLDIMANRSIPVEINLSSNALILNIAGAYDHPLPLYLSRGVPIIISSDDEGVNRSNLTKEFQRAVTTFHLNYPTLKTIIRNSIAYSFLPGQSLWQDNAYQKIVPACRKDFISTKTPSMQCQYFLEANEKAAEQWELEQRFNEFERNI